MHWFYQHDFIICCRGTTIDFRCDTSLKGPRINETKFIYYSHRNDVIICTQQNLNVPNIKHFAVVLVSLFILLKASLRIIVFLALNRIKFITAIISIIISTMTLRWNKIWMQILRKHVVFICKQKWIVKAIIWL